MMHTQPRICRTSLWKWCAFPVCVCCVFELVFIFFPSPPPSYHVMSRFAGCACVCFFCNRANAGPLQALTHKRARAHTHIHTHAVAHTYERTRACVTRTRTNGSIFISSWRSRRRRVVSPFFSSGRAFLTTPSPSCVAATDMCVSLKAADLIVLDVIFILSR